MIQSSKVFLKLVLFFSFIAQVQAQALIQHTFLRHYSMSELTALFGPVIQNEVDLYKVQYVTIDLFNQKDTASGLIIIPTNVVTPLPFLSYQHGTVNTKDDVPSNLRGGFELPLFWGSAGFITLAADFLGLGDSRGFHPYLHAETEARAAIDMIPAAEALVDELEMTWNEQLFLTGYSQGGHAALATQYYLETNPNAAYKVTASAPMSGPYSLSKVFVDFILSEAEYEFPNYLVWLTLSYRLAYDWDYTLEDLFKAEFVPAIEQYEKGIFSLNQLNSVLKQILSNDYGSLFAIKMFQDTLIENFNQEEDHPLRLALADNDLTQWKPTAPTRLYYCEMDEQVVYLNSVEAANSMKSLGSTDVEAINVFPDGNHSTCIEPAVTAALFFFGPYIDRNFTTTTTSLSQQPLKVYPNPAKQTVFLETNQSNPIQIRIYDIRGTLHRQQTVNQHAGKAAISVHDLHPGAYFISWYQAGQSGVEKIMIQPR